MGSSRIKTAPLGISWSLELSSKLDYFHTDLHLQTNSIPKQINHIPIKWNLMNSTLDLLNASTALWLEAIALQTSWPDPAIVKVHVEQCILVALKHGVRAKQFKPWKAMWVSDIGEGTFVVKFAKKSTLGCLRRMAECMNSASWERNGKKASYLRT